WGRSVTRGAPGFTWRPEHDPSAGARRPRGLAHSEGFGRSTWNERDGAGGPPRVSRFNVLANAPGPARPSPRSGTVSRVERPTAAEGRGGGHAPRRSGHLDGAGGGVP